MILILLNIHANFLGTAFSIPMFFVLIMTVCSLGKRT